MLLGFVATRSDRAKQTGFKLKRHRMTCQSYLLLEANNIAAVRKCFKAWHTDLMPRANLAVRLSCCFVPCSLPFPVMHMMTRS